MINLINKTCVVCALAVSAAMIGGIVPAFSQTTGPSTLSTPYVLPTQAVVKTESILTVADSIGGYRMVGIPDGLGAFDNGDGTFTLLMNHELGNGVGVTRAHGSKGAFVSKWIIEKDTLRVVSGSDLIHQVYLWDVTSQQSLAGSSPFAFNRFCSGDLPNVSAFYNAATGLGTQERIYMHGEEGGATGYQQATVVSGPNAGKSYVLGKFNLNTNGTSTSVLSPVSLTVTSASTASPNILVSLPVPPQLAPGAQLLGRTVVSLPTTTLPTTVVLSGNANANISSSTAVTFTLAGVGSWENALANPYPQNKTFVVATSDGGTGIMTNAVAVYVGTKQTTGSEADKAGLTNGTLKFINVTGNPLEIVNSATRATNIADGTRFTLGSTSATTFSRPEDGAWDPRNPNEFYFVTTDQLDTLSDGLGTQVGQTRLWKLTFDDITNPDLGGKIDLLIDGRTVAGQKVNMFDNITVNERTGQIVLLEDVGGAAHNGKVWHYDPATDALVQVARHDPARFGGVGLAATAPFNQDEETSGVIDVQTILGAGNYLFVDQAHYATGDPETVEGGQLMKLFVPLPVATDKDACKSAGWQVLFRVGGTSFKNQGDCIQYVNTGK